MCRVHAQDPAFAPDSSEVAVGFFVFLYLVVHNLPQLSMHTISLLHYTSFFVSVARGAVCPGASPAAKGRRCQVLHG